MGPKVFPDAEKSTKLLLMKLDVCFVQIFTKLTNIPTEVHCEY